MDRPMTADIGEIIKDATALYKLYNLFGRGKIKREGLLLKDLDVCVECMNKIIEQIRSEGSK